MPCKLYQRWTLHSPIWPLLLQSRATAYLRFNPHLEGSMTAGIGAREKLRARHFSSHFSMTNIFLKWNKVRGLLVSVYLHRKGMLIKMVFFQQVSIKKVSCRPPEGLKGSLQELSKFPPRLLRWAVI